MDGLQQSKPLSVLLLEGDQLIAMDMAEMITEHGLNVCGPCHTARDALAEVDRSPPDLAILDFNLKKGRTSALVAQRLSDMGVPLLFLSGYSATDVLERAGFADIPCLSKPVRPQELVAVLDNMRDGVKDDAKAAAHQPDLDLRMN